MNAKELQSSLIGTIYNIIIDYAYGCTDEKITNDFEGGFLYVDGLAQKIIKYWNTNEMPIFNLSEIDALKKIIDISENEHIPLRGSGFFHFRFVEVKDSLHQLI